MNKAVSIYYSNKCQHSRELIKKIASMGIKNNFNYICIDTELIPPFIKSVPSLLVNDNNNNKLFVGEEIHNYINSNYNNSSSENGGDPAAWHNNEMGSAFSDQYSFIENNSSISHSFSFLDGQPNNIPHNINNQQQSNSSNNDHQDKLTQDMEKLLQQRDRDLPNIIQRI